MKVIIIEKEGIYLDNLLKFLLELEIMDIYTATSVGDFTRFSNKNDYDLIISNPSQLSVQEVKLLQRISLNMCIPLLWHICKPPKKVQLLDYK